MRFRHRAAAGFATLLLPLASLVGLASPAQAAANATAAYAKTQDWGTGFEGKWTVTNTGSASISSWTVEWDFPSGTAVTSAWDADVTSSGTHWTAKNKSYNATLAPGASVSFGFNGTGSGSPSNCRLNGDSCDGTTVPGDAAPSAPGTPTASDITDTSVNLSWSAATDDKGVKNYDVLRDGKVVSTVTTTSYSDTGLTAGTDYSYTVRARDTADQTGPVSGAVAVHTTGTTTDPPPTTGGKVKLGYFTEWGIYGRNYNVRNLVTSGSAAKITHINYAFGNVTNGQCAIGDSYADYDKAFTADQSVSGVADTWDQPLRGNWNQLKKLKAKHPGLKVLISLGGWTWSRGFASAARPENRQAFVASCIDAYIRGNLPVTDGAGGAAAAAGVFDGIDIDWEYPNACGISCGSAEDRQNFTALLAEFRRQLNEVRSGLLLTVAVGAGVDKIRATDPGQYHPSLDYINVMTYDFHGAFEPITNHHSALFDSPADPSTGDQRYYNSNDAMQAFLDAGVPAAKLNLGIGFYGRGWTNVANVNNGLYQSGSPAPGTYEAGIEDYKVLKNAAGTSHTDSAAGAHWKYNGSTFWSYDTPAVIGQKMGYVKAQGLGGAFFWEFSGDAPQAELVKALSNGLQ